MPIAIMSLHVMGFFLLQYVKKSCGLVLVLTKAEGWGSVTLLKIGILRFAKKPIVPNPLTFCPHSPKKVGKIQMTVNM